MTFFSVSKRQDAQRSSSTNCFHTTGAAPAKRLAFCRALSALMETTTRWRCRLAKEGQAPAPAPNHPKGRQRQLANGPALKSTVSGQKDCPHLPLPRAHSSLHHTSLAQTNLFPLADSAHQLETIWQKQSSNQCQLRKILLPTTSPAPLKLAAHTLFSALSFSALGTILSLPSPRVRIQRHQGLLTH